MRIAKIRRKTLSSWKLRSWGAGSASEAELLGQPALVRYRRVFKSSPEDVFIDFLESKGERGPQTLM